MIYHLKSSRRENKGRKLFYRSFVLLIIVLLFSYNGTLRAGTSSALQGVGVPIWKMQNYVNNGQTGFFAYFRSKKLLALENQMLKEKNQALADSNLKTVILQDENESLKGALSRTNKGNRVLASVLVWPSKSLYDSLLLDVGNDQGIVPGDFVAVDDVYIGKVSEVFAHSAKVVLFSSSGQKFDVLLNPSHVSVTAYGRGGNFEAEVPRGIDLAIGDVVTVPGIGVDIFATVEDIIEKPTDAYKTILFKNPVNVETLKWVEIIKP